MSVEMQEMIHFRLTGKSGAGAVAGVPGTDTYPALLVPIRDLSKLRYDFPLLLLDDENTQAFVDTLTGVINRLLRDIAPQGNAGEQLRQHVLRLEARMRELAGDENQWSLFKLWKRAEKSLLAECDEVEAELLGSNLATARFALRLDGQVVNCDRDMPVRLLEHAWAKNEKHRSRDSRKKIDSLITRLRNILKVDDLKHDRSRTPGNLKKAVGRRYKEDFDFDLMSELLEDSIPRNQLPANRRKRIRAALKVLVSQRFFATTNKYRFVFDRLSLALKAYKDRLPEIANVIKAISVAELECENAYREEQHSSYFERFGPQALAPEDLALFPSYLVCLHETECNSRDLARLMEVVADGLPIKILLQVGDGLVQQLARTFVAGDAYVLQTTASNLYRQEVQIRKGLAFDGPAIFSVFTPSADLQFPVYLVAAAAMESRVFPAFSYDPSAGPGLADRFDISNNAQVESDWTRHELRYEDEELQTIAEGYAFTLADFALTQSQFSEHFALAPKEGWSDDMVTVADYLELADADTLDKLPFVAVVDGENKLQRLVVDDRLIRIVRRCRERWHALQELGGVNNSYVRAELADFKLVALDEVEQADEIVPVQIEDQADAEPEQAAEATSDDAYIETPRCTTCDECTDMNDRMFAYDENKQAYIKDIDAGTYRQLVEAAEDCQVAVIHPGKPRNPDEPGLEELIARAEPFMAS